ncbi:hypothetical protein ACA910_008225 [Epithemia clementina (nom. ined.)]
MSSLRNAVKRITHKERAQPRARSHLGILEKKKDYAKRAKDYHKKEKLVNRLRQKASMRNPDEFYFAMKNSEVKNGKHRKTQELKQKEFDEKIGHDTIRVMKDQDLSYVRMQRAKDKKKIERLQASLHLLDGSLAAVGREGVHRKHTIFVDSKEEAEEFDAAQHFDTLPELVGRVHNRPRNEMIREMALGGTRDEATEQQGGINRDSDATNKTLALVLDKKRKVALLDRNRARRLARARASAYREMEARAERVRAMEKAEAHLLTENMVAAKGRKRKIQGEQDGMPAQYVWRTKRLK